MMARLKVPTARYWFDRRRGEERSNTQWHTVLFYGRLAEVVLREVVKNDRIMVDGSLEYYLYTDEATGETGRIAQLTAHEFAVVGEQQDPNEYYLYRENSKRE